MGYRWDQPAYSLSYANRRRLEIARATATNPRILLLDEPAAGMNPSETHEITELIGQLRTDGGYTILVIEHDMHVVEGISDRVDRARPRHQDRRGLVRAGRDRTRRSSRRTSASQTARAQMSRRLLELDAVDTYYGQIHILQGLSLSVEPGELVCLLGGNASGKSTTLKTILGIVRPRNGDGADQRRGRHLAADELPHRPRPRDRPGEPPSVRADDGAREPRDGRLPARRRREGGLRPRLRALPAAARPADAAGGHALRRRAADGRDGPCADVAAEAAADGRAVDGARADPRRAQLRDHQAGARVGRRDARSSSRMRTCRSRSPTAATFSRPAGSCSRARPPTCARTKICERHTLAVRPQTVAERCRSPLPDLRAARPTSTRARRARSPTPFAPPTTTT